MRVQGAGTPWPDSSDSPTELRIPPSSSATLPPASRPSHQSLYTASQPSHEAAPPPPLSLERLLTMRSSDSPPLRERQQHSPGSLLSQERLKRSPERPWLLHAATSCGGPAFSSPRRCVGRETSRMNRQPFPQPRTEIHTFTRLVWGERRHERRVEFSKTAATEMHISRDELHAWSTDHYPEPRSMSSS